MQLIFALPARRSVNLLMPPADKNKSRRRRPIAHRCPPQINRPGGDPEIKDDVKSKLIDGNLNNELP
jgi:hypothetical protein